jgi:hypothetical protein
MGSVAGWTWRSPGWRTPGAPAGRPGSRSSASRSGPTWTLIAELLRRNPRLHGTLADLLETPARARQYLAGLGLDGRCEVVGQSFFDPLPPGAAAYLLSRIIHDWDDAAASTILRMLVLAGGFCTMRKDRFRFYVDRIYVDPIYIDLRCSKRRQWPSDLRPPAVYGVVYEAD